MTLSQSAIFYSDDLPYKMEVSNMEAATQDWSVEVSNTDAPYSHTIAEAVWLENRQVWDFRIVKLDAKDFQADTMYETRLKFRDFMDTLEEFKTALEELH